MARPFRTLSARTGATPKTSPARSEDPVRAAGGVVLRPSGEGVEVLLVHRPRYDDWALPKGKAEPSETDEECALREVEEETGLRCRLDRELGEMSYRDGSGRPKTVRYFAMRPVAGEFAPNDEVDEVRWLAPPAAEALLTYEGDREIVGSL